LKISRRDFLKWSVAAGVALNIDNVTTVLAATNKTSWINYRGMNVGIYQNLVEQDFIDYAATGGQMLRIVCTDLRSTTKPYAFDESKFTILETFLGFCQKYNIKAVVDVHTTPGTQKNFDGVFWSDFTYHDLLIGTWNKIASKYANTYLDTIVGYDLLNEPYIPYSIKNSKTPADINLLYANITSTIRKYDTKRTIILEIPDARPLGNIGLIKRVSDAQSLNVPTDSNTIWSIHMYESSFFVFQGMNIGFPNSGVTFPGTTETLYWDKDYFKKLLLPLKLYSDLYQIPIWVGECSCARWLGDSFVTDPTLTDTQILAARVSTDWGGNYWLQCALEIFEAWGWNWCYYAWRESTGWDAEKSNTLQIDETKYATTPRLDYLKTNFAKAKTVPFAAKPVAVVTPSTVYKTQYGVATGDGISIRTGAGTQYSWQGSFALGTKINILGTAGSFYKVRYSGITGYVSNQYVKITSK